MTNILIIDDEKYVADVVQRALTRLGYQVTTVNSGQKGMTLLETNHFDLIVTDIIMPGITGLDIANQIHGSNKSRPAIIGMSGTPWVLNTANFDAVLSKPFTLKNLSRVVENVLNDHREEYFLQGFSQEESSLEPKCFTEAERSTSNAF